MQKVEVTCIIDDDPIYVFSVKRVMEIANLCQSVLIFHNGKEAYEKLNAIFTAGEKLPELIMLDLNMPIWDGWHFLDEFIKIPITQKITIYIVSSSIDPADIEKAKSYEAVSSFIVKPVTLDKLKEILERQN
jgi:CheY-like chemotaxis protein